MPARCRRRRTDMDSKTAMGSEPQHSQVRPDFERIALLLQGGGALGAYQGGVYQALAEADLHPHWVAGISIGAINSALIAGNPPERRVERLREFWETVTRSPLGLPYLAGLEIKDETAHQFLNQLPPWTPCCGAPRTSSSRATCRRSSDAPTIRRG